MSPVQASRAFEEPQYNPDGYPPSTPDAVRRLSAYANGGFTDREIRDALERLLADRRLRMSERNRRFLRFVVEEKLAGRAERIKSYTIAVDVFGRAPTFDSITDPIVRIEATRLRAALADYYGEGGDSPIEIEIPKGGYVPVFHRAGHAKAARGAADTANVVPIVPAIPQGSYFPAAWRRAALVFLALAIVGGVAAGSYFLAQWLSDPRLSAPIIAVEPVRSSVGSETERELAQGLTQSVLSSLSRFSGVRLVYLRDDAARDTMQEKARGVPVYVVESNLRTGDGILRFWWSIADGDTGETLWSENVDQPLNGNIASTIEDRIAARVSARIAEPYGIVSTKEPADLGSTGPGYYCVLQARAQLAFPEPGRHARIRHCLEQTIAFAPQYADAWALLALTYLYEERFGRSAGGLTKMALEAADRAVQLAPHSALAYLAVLDSRFRIGDFAAADKAAARALELNPNDPQILHTMGLRAYIRGNREEGLARIEESIALSGRMRPSAQFILALDAYRRGDYAGAQQLLAPLQERRQACVLALSAASSAQAGDAAVARRDLDALQKLYPDYEAELRRQLEAMHFEPSLVAILVDGVERARQAAN